MKHFDPEIIKMMREDEDRAYVLFQQYYYSQHCRHCEAKHSSPGPELVALAFRQTFLCLRWRVWNNGYPLNGKLPLIPADDFLGRHADLYFDFWEKDADILRLMLDKARKKAFKKLDRVYADRVYEAFKKRFPEDVSRWRKAFLYAKRQLYRTVLRSGQAKSDRPKPVFLLCFLRKHTLDFQKRLIALQDRFAALYPYLFAEEFQWALEESLKTVDLADEVELEQEFHTNLLRLHRSAVQFPEDADVIWRIQNDDRLMLRKLYQDLRGDFQRVALKQYGQNLLVPGEAIKDAFQEALFTLVNYVERGKIRIVDDNLVGLVLSVRNFVIRIGLNNLKGKDPDTDRLADCLDRLENSPEMPDDRSDELLVFTKLRCIEALNEKHQELLRLLFVKRLDRDQAAEILDYSTSSNTLDKTLERIRKKLAKCIKAKLALTDPEMNDLSDEMLRQMDIDLDDFRTYLLAEEKEKESDGSFKSERPDEE